MVSVVCLLLFLFMYNFIHNIAGAQELYLQPLLEVSGEQSSLKAASEGQRLVVVIMKNSGCPVCIGQLHSLGLQAEKLEAVSTRVIGLTTDKPQDLKKSSVQSFPILSDPEHQLTEKLGLWRADWGHPLPALVVFNRCGIERARLEGRRPGSSPDSELFLLLEEMAKQPASCEEVS